MFDPTKVRVVGGWPAHLDDKDRIKMRVGDEKKLLFDVGEAGPGKLSAEVRGPSGLIPVRVEMTSKDRVKVSFTPVAEGQLLGLFCRLSGLSALGAWNGYASLNLSQATTMCISGGRSTPSPTPHCRAGRSRRSR